MKGEGMARNSLVLVLISDTHELHREVDIPNGDILIHAGDFTMFGKSQRAIEDFNAWLGELPHRHKIVICGNHEYAFDENPQYYRQLTNAVVLVNEPVVIEGAKFWGSAFSMLDESGPARSREAERRRIYEAIPLDTDVVITHGPPYGVLDTTVEYQGHTGDRELLRAIRKVKPKLHVFGHIHASYGVRRTTDTVFVNAALLDWDGSLAKSPVVVRLTEFKLHEPDTCCPGNAETAGNLREE
jgi:Icc-related predicted phosphoesterase